MQETEIYEWSESFCARGQGWEFSGNEDMAMKTMAEMVLIVL